MARMGPDSVIDGCFWSSGNIVPSEVWDNHYQEFFRKYDDLTWGYANPAKFVQLFWMLNLLDWNIHEREILR